MSLNRRLALGAGLAALASPALFRPSPADAQTAAPAPAPQTPGFFRFRVGDVPVTVVQDGFGIRANAVQGHALNATNAEVEAALREAALPTTNLPNPFNVTFLHTGRGVVALDAGTGGGQLSPSSGLLARQNLRAAGIDPAAVTLVAISHFHGDHITGLTNADNTPFFPNAEVAVPAAEWAWFSDDSNAARSPEIQRGTFPNTQRRFAPYRARMKMFRDGEEIAPGLRAISAHGHTPGHSIFHLSSGTEQLFYTADASSRPDLFLRNPNWHLNFDFDGAMAAETRRRLFGRIADERARLTAYHFNFPSNGYVTRMGEGFRFHAAEWTSAL